MGVLMSIELDGLPLIKHVRDEGTGATKEFRSVNNIKVSEKRSIIVHRFPCSEGGALQNLGREPVRISFEGIIYGEGAKDGLQQIRSKFKAGKPVSFSSDLSGVAEVTQVLVESLQVEEIGGTTNRYRYRMALREYSPPPGEEEPPPSQEEEAKEETEQTTDDAQGSVNFITGDVVDADGNPLSDVDVKISFDGGEYTVKTDDNGVFRKDNLDPGTYIVTIDAEGFEDVEKEVVIKSGTEETEVKEKKPEKKTGQDG
jgi:hypothetical protein